MVLIAIEGLDASGKNTVSKLLAQHLHEKISDVKLLSCPDYSKASGHLIRELLKRSKHGIADSALLQCYNVANRLEMLPQSAWDSSSSVVHIIDRYNDSTIVYGIAAGLDKAWLESLVSLLPRSDLTLFLDVSVDESFRRRPQRRDTYETDREFLTRVRAAYKELYAISGRAVTIDASGSVDKTIDMILPHVDQLVVALNQR